MFMFNVGSAADSEMSEFDCPRSTTSQRSTFYLENGSVVGRFSLIWSVSGYTDYSAEPPANRASLTLFPMAN